jgi:ABC-2 type transport system permease protein
MNKYFAFAASSFQTRLAYRTEVWASIFGAFITILARVAIWAAAYQGVTTVSGATLSDMTTYAILGGTVIGAWHYQDMVEELGEQIRSGNVAIYLLKPLHYPLYLFFTEIGRVLCRVLLVVGPVVVISAFAFGMQAPASLFHGVMFVLFWALSFAILFTISATCGLMAFWMMTTFSLTWFLQAVITILSGYFVPLWLFPGGSGAIVQMLPFAWIGYYPTSVYLGRFDVADTLAIFAFGLAWLAVIAGFGLFLWRRASLRISVQGG